MFQEGGTDLLFGSVGVGLILPILDLLFGSVGVGLILPILEVLVGSTPA